MSEPSNCFDRCQPEGIAPQRSLFPSWAINCLTVELAVFQAAWGPTICLLLFLVTSYRDAYTLLLVDFKRNTQQTYQGLCHKAQGCGWQIVTVENPLGTLLRTFPNFDWGMWGREDLPTGDKQPGDCLIQKISQITYQCSGRDTAKVSVLQ